MASWPDLRTLELLLVTAREGSLSLAAAAVGMAQPNASRAITALERELGLTLLERSPRGSRLTAHGQLVASWAAPVVDHARAWQTGIAALGTPATTALTVLASQTVSESLAPRWLAVFRARRSDVAATLHVTNSAAVAEGIRTGAGLIGFVEGPDAPPDLARARVRRDRLCVVVSPGHPWARRTRPLSLRQLAATPLVVREEGSGTRETLERGLRGLPRAGHALVMSSNAAVLASAAMGSGPAVLSELAVAAAVAAGSVVPVSIERPDAFARTLRAVWRPDADLSPPAREFLGIALGQ